MLTIEHLEARLAALQPEALPPREARAARRLRRQLQARLAELRLAQANDWARRNWLDCIERVLDELGRRVDRLVCGRR